MNESKRNLNGALSVGARITLRDFPCRSSLFMEGSPLSSGGGPALERIQNRNQHWHDGKGIVSQSVFVPLIQVSPSTLQFVSLDISGGFVCHSVQVGVCVCHSVRVTPLIIAAASGFPQELTRRVM